MIVGLIHNTQRRELSRNLLLPVPQPIIVLLFGNLPRRRHDADALEKRQLGLRRGEQASRVANARRCLVSLTFHCKCSPSGQDTGSWCPKQMALTNVLDLP